MAPAGRKLGNYEIRQKLGRGGMADVYLAQDVESNALVALKLIEHSDDSDTRDFIEAERRGADLQASLAAVDPRVARVYDSGDRDGYFYVAMEYVDGQDLSALMKNGPLEPEFAVDVAIGVARTLENAHNLEVVMDGRNCHGIVHGDIKPKNIRIDSHGEVRVLDFGIAKALSLSRRLTRNEFGSVPYASPERLDTGEVNAYSDLWSLAVMLYEMATGRQPYQNASTEQLERVIRSRAPAPPAPSPCPEGLSRILAKAMAPDPEDRYASAREFAESLAAFRRGEPDADQDATRRTVRTADDSTRRTVGRVFGGRPDNGSAAGEETRRTAAIAGEETRRTAAGASAQPRGNDVKPRRSKFRKVMRGVGVFFIGMAIYLGLSGYSSYRLYERGKAFQRELETEQISDVDKIWDKWTELSKGHSASWLLRGPESLVRAKLLSSADRVIISYRNDAQQLYEGDWKRARSNLARALELDPDKTARGELRLVEGHLARINGTAHRSVPVLNEAVADFNEAQSLMPKSPDPQLGLARLYVYGFRDIDKAYEALQQAGKRGYRLGNRDKTQLADGYQERADRLWTDSLNVRGLPQEKEQIQRAQQDYQTAVGLYQQVAPYGNSNAEIVKVQQDLDAVNQRLQEIERENSGSFLQRLLRWP